MLVPSPWLSVGREFFSPHGNLLYCIRHLDLGSNVYDAAEPFNLHHDLWYWAAVVIVVKEANREAPQPAV